MTGIAFNHLVGRFKTSIGDFSHRELIMVSLLSRNDWSIGDKGEIDSWVGPNYFVDNLKKQEKNCKQTAATSIAEKFINFRAQQKLTFVNLLVVSSTSQMFIWIEA